MNQIFMHEQMSGVYDISQYNDDKIGLKTGFLLLSDISVLTA
jgi:hypothetical protein